LDRFEEVIPRIKDGADLVALVEEYVPLKTRGRYHIGLCPFHQEKTPSFTVYSDSQHYKCYGCGEAGDVFSFLMKRDGLAFREAAEVLGERQGIDMTGVFGRGRGDGKKREDVHGALARVSEFFQAELQLASGAAARAYLEDRGLDAAIEGFKLGYHPPGGKLHALAQKEKLSRAALEQAGLVGEDGYERFAGRLMFPIEDERGRTTGFGGRVLESHVERAKYLNSPESPFFNKRKLLFGLRQAKKAGVRRLAVMEGYTDVIAAHLAGFEGAVATLGTALTTDHAKLLERYATDGVVLLFDGDRAGRQAADRAFRELVHTRLPVSVALLDEGTDPADLVTSAPGRDAESVAKGRELLQNILDGADDALTVWFRLIRQRIDLTLDVNVERSARECGRILGSIEDQVRRQALGQRMAQHLGLQEAVFWHTASQQRPAHRSGPKAQIASASESQSDGVEIAPGADPNDSWANASPRPNGAPGPDGGPTAVDGPLVELGLDLLACLLCDPELLDQADEVVVTLPIARELLGLFRDGIATGKSSKDEIVGYLFMRCAERPDLSQHLASCMDRAAHIKSPSETLSLLLKDLSAHQSRHEAQNIRFRLQEARDQGDRALVDKLTQEYLQQLRNRSRGNQ